MHVVLAVSVVVVTSSCGTDIEPASPVGQSSGTAQLVDAEVVVHRSPTCPCCGGLQDAMRAAGATLTEEHHDDMERVKDDRGIPTEQRSCHTSEVDGYFLEGHVPLQAVADLLEKRPAIDGIALAGMPPGAPGMSGDKTGAFVVTAIVDGKVVGEFGRY